MKKLFLISLLSLFACGKPKEGFSEFDKEKLLRLQAQLSLLESEYHQKSDPLSSEFQKMIQSICSANGISDTKQCHFNIDTRTVTKEEEKKK